jgi:hypothetical protein
MGLLSAYRVGVISNYPGALRPSTEPMGFTLEFWRETNNPLYGPMDETVETVQKTL